MRMKADSDLDDSSDPDVIVHLSNALGRSVFNITSDIPGDETKETTERTEYEKRLNAETDEWHSLLKNTKQVITDLPSADYSVLSPENLAYLKNAPDLNKFIEESIEFRKEANIYLEEYAETLKLHENLAELCVYRLDTKKSQLIEEYIFNIPRQHREIN